MLHGPCLNKQLGFCHRPKCDPETGKKIPWTWRSNPSGSPPVTVKKWLKTANWQRIEETYPRTYPRQGVDILSDPGTAIPRPGWGAILTGHAYDLSDWANALKPGFDPWVEIHNGETVLRSASLDALTDHGAVRRHAEWMISFLNGALAVSEKSEPVQMISVVGFEGRALHRYVELAPAVFKIRGGKIGVAIIRPGEMPPPPTPTEVQAWATIAGTNDVLADALVFFGRSTNWFDLYKCFECVRRAAGGEAELAKLHPTLTVDIDLMTWTANSARHAPRIGMRPPPNPMELSAARALTGVLLRRALQV